MAYRSSDQESASKTDEPKARWVHIQLNTFTNWLNEQLHTVDSHIDDLGNDLSDGVILIQAIEVLQQRQCTGKIYRNNPTEIQMLMNVQMALDALRRDGIKLVNIGSHDIVEGNLKLILGLVWSLIQRYQIASKTKIPAKKLMMAWMQSVLPDLKLTNFRTNWNDGRALSALLEYCQPGLCPEWRHLNQKEGLVNCQRALLLAERYLGIPPIISAEHLSSPDLDELSCITYLSYFTKKNACGYRSTMARVQQLLNDATIDDFSGTWCDGYLLCVLVESVGGEVPQLSKMEYDQYHNWVYNVRCGLDAAADIGVGSLVSAEDIADPQGEHLGVMALAAALCSVGPTASFPTTQCFQDQQVNLDLAFADGSEVRTDELDVEVIGPTGDVLAHDAIRLRKSRTAKGAVLSLIPTTVGYHQIRILCQNTELPSSPISLQVLPSPESEERDTVPTASIHREPVRRVLSASKRQSPDEEIAIENQSFAQRRAQIVKKLEEQRIAVERAEQRKVERSEVRPATSSVIKSAVEAAQPPSTRRDVEELRYPEEASYRETERITYTESTIIKESRPKTYQPHYQEDDHSPPRKMPVRSVSDVGLVSFSGLNEPCAVGSIVEVVINAHGDASSGDVVVEAEAPSKRILQCPVNNKNHSYTATFTPEEVGPWKIGILYEGAHIRGSPFNCQVYDANLVSVYGLDVGLVGQELKFSVNASQAGQGHVNVSVLRHGRTIPTSVEEHGHSQVYTVTFVPDGAGQYKIHVLFNNMEVKGSPFILDIADASSVSVYGENLRMASVDKTAHFMIHAVGAEPKDITVTITAPSGKTKYGRILPVEDGSFKVEWKPVEAGEHSVDVRLYDQSVYESPFVCNVGDPELVSVRNMPRRMYAKDLNNDHSFEIDASAAGSGNLEIMINGGRVPCRVRELGSRQYLALFTPTQAMTHTIEMRFNGESVRGSPWKVDVDSGTGQRRQNMDKTMSYYSELSGAGLVRAPVDKNATFDISGDGLELSDIQAKIHGPDGREYPVNIIPKGPGKYTAEYTIDRVGEHQLTVWIAGRKVDGSPLSVAGYSADKVRLEPLGGGTPGQPVQFVVDAVEAGKGQLEISVNQGRVPNNVQMQGAGRCLVTFIPQHAGTYVIDVTFNGEPVHGCPIKVEILPKQVGQSVAAPITPAYSPATSPTQTQTSSFHTGIAGGYAARGPTSPQSPTSPTLLRQARNRSADATTEQLRSPSLLKNIDTARSRFERFDNNGADKSPKPWEKSSVTSVPRVSQSFSPARETRTYTETTTTTYGDRAPSAVSPKPMYEQGRGEYAETTTSTYRTASPAGSLPRDRSDSRGAASTGPTSPVGILKKSESPRPGYEQATRHFVEHGAPTTPRRGSGQYLESSAYRSTSPILGPGEKIRMSEQFEPHRSPSPILGPGEKIRRIEQIDPLAREEERNREISEWEGTNKGKVGYTVAQYGEPGHVEKAPESPQEDTERKTDQGYRFFGDTVKDKHDAHRPSADSERETGAPTTYDPPAPKEITRTESPIYSSVYERFERKEDRDKPDKGFATSTPHIDRQRPPTPPRDFDESSISKSPEADKTPFYSGYIVEEKRYRSPSPPKYGRTEEIQVETKGPGGHIYEQRSTEKIISPGGGGDSTYAGYVQPDYTETTTTRITSYSVSPRGRSDEQIPGPGGRFTEHHAEIEEQNGALSKTKSEKFVGQRPAEQGFLRTQSEIIKEFQDGTQPTGIRRSEEKESIYDIPPETTVGRLNRVSEVPSSDLPEAARRTAEYMKVKEEDDRILEKHGLAPPPIHHHQQDSNERQPSRDSMHQPIRDSLSYMPSVELSEPEPMGEIHDVVEVADKTTTDRPLLRQSTDREVEERGNNHHLNTLHPAVELPHSPAVSQPTTPKATPKNTLKKKGDKDGKPFDFGKSKFTSRHEVVRRGKDVEVKMESLKLGKEDTLRIVVVPPVRNLPPGEHPGELETKVKKSGSKYEISFKPTEVGTHKLFAYVNEIQHPLSPFPIRVYDSTEIIVGDIPNQSRLNDTVEFTVDAGRAGFGNLEMAIKDADGVIIPSHVAQLETGSAKFLVTFTPATKGTHTVNITFNKEVLKNSPFEVHITDPVAEGALPGVATPELSKKDLKREKEEKKREEKERAKREKEEKLATLKREKDLKKGKKPVEVTKTTVTKIPSLSRVGQPSHLLINVAGNEQLEINVFRASPEGGKNTVPTEVVEIEPGVMQIGFTPEVVGDHEIEVKYAGAHVSGSPFTCRAYDPARIHVGTIPTGVVDKHVHFVVDASEAGVGNLEVAVNDGRIPSMANSLGQHRYDISFVPHEAQDHTITVRFNNEPVPGSPFICKLVAANQITASGPGLERISVGEPSEITLTTSGEEPPKVTVKDPQGNDVDADVIPGGGNTFTVKYTPKTVGNHVIDVSYLGEPVAGSPFTAKAYDANMARLTPCEGARVGKPSTFSIDAARAGAGNMEIIVSVDGRNVPNFVQAEGQARFKVSFTPQEAREHVISVRFNGQSIPGSPMKCMVAPATETVEHELHRGAQLIEAPLTQTQTQTTQKTTHTTSAREEQVTTETKLISDMKSAQVGQKKGFTIENIGKSGDCNVIVTAPDGTRPPVRMERAGEDDMRFEFTPRLQGDHEIEVIIDGVPIGEPAIFHIGPDLSKSKLPSTCVVGKKYSFEIPTNGRSRHEARIDIRGPDGKSLPVQLEDMPNGNVRVSFRFKQIGSHSVDCFLNDTAIGERQFVDVVDGNRGVQLISEVTKEVVGQPSELKLLIDKDIESQLEMCIYGPDNQIVPVDVRRLTSTMIVAEWVPQVEGDHELAVLVGGEHIGQSPYLISVLDPSAVRVIGLKNERVGVEQRFNIDYSNSGASNASVDVKLNGKTINCQLKRIRDGLLVCVFVPKIPGLYLVDVLIDGLSLPECPYECYITDQGAVRASGDALRRAQRGRTARFEVTLNDATRGELDVLVSDATGGPLPVRCYKQQDDSYWVEFTPEQTGEHTIEVTFGDVPVPGSPFKCHVIDPKKILVKGLQEGLTLRHATTVSLNRREAGTNDLSVEVTDPTGRPLKVEMIKSPTGEDRATFLPTQLGPHKVNVKASGFPLPGYPQTINVEEMALPSVYGAAVDQSVKINEPASLIFDPKKANGGLKIDVRGPNKQKVRHNTMRRPNGTSEVVFYPEEVGTYNVNIHFNNKPVAGTPVDVRVVDPSKVLINDEAVDRDGSMALQLNQRNVFDVDATAAGPGKLRAEVRDADNTLLKGGPVVEELGYGKWRVAFEPRTPGRYAIYLYWNELPVESAYPIRVVVGGGGPSAVPTTSKYDYATSSVQQEPRHKQERSGTSNASYDDEATDHTRIILRGDGLRKAHLKEPNEFIIDGSEVPRDGRLTATLIGQKADIPVKVSQLGPNVFKALYTPAIGGNYELHVLWNGRHVKGSPFPVTVASSNTPADLITVDTSTLKIGIINEDIKTLIDTRRAGPGQLSAQCMGPVKLAYCELYDHRDGTYTLSIRPTEVGKHTLVIKYNEDHVSGSPFLVHVSMPPDPSKVRVYGPGIEHGILSTFKSNFVVETKGAGAGQLTVRVRGPKGAFNVEMQREKKNERTIHCKYEPREPGDYQVEVKWHGEHVPGSPFLVMIVDTEQELARFLRGDAPSPTPATPFIPPGWIGPPPPPIFPGGPGGRALPSVMPPRGPYGPPMGGPPPGAMMNPYGPPPSRGKKYTNGY